MDAVVAAWRQANAAATASTSSTAQQSFVNLSEVREEDAQLIDTASSLRRAACTVDTPTTPAVPYFTSQVEKLYDSMMIRFIR